MNGRLPPLNPLRAFEATARLGSVSAAARELRVTHGAVSHQLKALEESLNTALFERGGKRMKLTSAGALLLPAVTQAFSGIAAATAQMQRPATRGSLSITCVPALLSFWIVPRLSSFTDQYPDLTLKLAASNDPRHLHSSEVDVCVLYGDGNWPDVWTRLWSNLQLFPVASPTLFFCMAIPTAGNGTRGLPRPTGRTFPGADSISWAMHASPRRQRSRGRVSRWAIR